MKDENARKVSARLARQEAAINVLEGKNKAQSSRIAKLEAALKDLLHYSKEALPHLPNPGYGWHQVQLDGAIIRSESALEEK